jgi:pyruvate dehydrogenase E1 component beta subunit
VNVPVTTPPSRTMTLIQAVNAALAEEMERNPAVVIIGEDVGRNGGVFRATEGLWSRFGARRVVDAPLAEDGIVGMAIGMALNGLRPVAEIQFADFIFPAFDQIVSELAKFRYRSAGQFPTPVVIRTPSGGGIKGGHYHSQSPEAYFIHTAGLKVVMPSTPADAKGLLTAAMRDPDPVIFFEPKALYRTVKGEVPEGDYTVPLGQARTVREGDDVTVITYGAMVVPVGEAAQKAAEAGIGVEVIDLRTLWPLDIETVVRSAEKTGRVVVVHEAPRTCGYGAELVALVQEKAFLHLKAPIARVTGFDTPFPYALEKLYMPDARRVSQAISEIAVF